MYSFDFGMGYQFYSTGAISFWEMLVGVFNYYKKGIIVAIIVIIAFKSRKKLRKLLF